MWYYIFHVGKRSINQFRPRRQIPVNNDICNNKDVLRSVLFVLDTSGSITETSFRRMTAAISRLTTLFCNPVQFAMMTFNHRRWLEFCFNCFENTIPGRNNARQAISNAVYHSGLTHTGQATRCICNELLNDQTANECGLSQDSCIDVVYITDGHSNGPLEVCTEVECLHSKRFTNTYAIGINNYNETEIKCISKHSSSETVFGFESFDEFEEYFNNVTTALTNPVNLGKYHCVHRNQDQNPTLSP